MANCDVESRPGRPTHLGFRISFGPQHSGEDIRQSTQTKAERIVREGTRPTTRPIPHLWAVCPHTETGLPNLYTGRVGAPDATPWHLNGSEPCQGHPNVVYKGCTPDAQRMLTLETVVQPLCIRCAPLVHSQKSRRGG